MSAAINSYTAQYVLSFRSQHTKPGVRKSAKAAHSRAHRRAGKAGLLKATELAPVDVFADCDLETWADDFLAAAQPEDALSADSSEADDLLAEAELVELESGHRMPLHLIGSLPDWMLEQVEDSEGDAFAHLSLFEKKSSTTPAAISMVDELMFA